MSTRPIILFDIDQTLLNTQVLAREVFDAGLAEKLGLDIDTFLEKKAAFKHTLPKYTDFDPKEFVRALTGTDPATATELYQSLFGNSSHFKKYLYPELLSTLDRLKENCELGIFSEGVIDWQQSKLDLLDIRGYFNPNFIFILRRKLTPEAFAALPTNVVIVDDNPEVIDFLDSHHITTYWIPRDETPSNPVWSHSTKINSLQDIQIGPA